MPKKILSIGTAGVFHTSELTPLPEFPRRQEDLGAYLLAINPAIEVGLVTKSDREEARMNKLQLIIVCLNMYRIVETFPFSALQPAIRDLTRSGLVGDKFLKILDFLKLAKERYETEPDLVERFYQSETIFNGENYGNPGKANAIIDSFLELYPPNGDKTDKQRVEKYRSFSGSDYSGDEFKFSATEGSKIMVGADPIGLSALHLQDVEDDHTSNNDKPRKLSGSGSDHSKESDPSSQGREDFVSLTSATLRRTLKNYWRAQAVGVVVQDDILRLLWDKSIIGKSCTAELLEPAISFFPLELAFLWDRKTQVVGAFNVGKSHSIEIRELTEEEKAQHTVIIHNHPHGDTFSLEDLVLCSNKGAKEVRAVTISCESYQTMGLKSYHCEISHKESFGMEEHKNLLNAFYLYFSSGDEIETELEPYKIRRGSLKFRENEFSVLESVGLVRFYGTCDKLFNCPDNANLQAWFQNEAKCSRRGLSLEQRLTVLNYLSR